MIPIRAVVLAFAFAALSQPASAQQRVDHLEGCAPAEKNTRFVRIKNGCDQPVSLIFWRYYIKEPVTRILQPGEVFEDDFTGDSGWWMSTACPYGYDPDPPFALENTKVIVESTYSCVSKQVSQLR